MHASIHRAVTPDRRDGIDGGGSGRHGGGAAPGDRHTAPVTSTAPWSGPYNRAHS